LPIISQHKGQDTASDMAAVFAALGDDTRLAIVSRLQDGTGQSITSLTQSFSLTRQGVSRHLHVLEGAGLVRCHRVGREARYHLETEALNRAQTYLARASAQWDDAINRLAKHLDY